MHDENSAHDPHLWFDVALWRDTAGVVRDALKAFDPRHADEYQKRADVYQSDLAKLHDYAKTQLATVPKDRRVLVTAHDAFGYFGRRYGFQVAAIQGVSTTTEATTTEETTTAPPGTDGPNLALTSGECVAVIGAITAVSQAFAGVASNADQSDLLDQYADRVPDDVKADFQTLVDYAKEVAEAYAKLGLSPSETPSAEQLEQYQADLAAIDQEELSAASERISAWTSASLLGKYW